MPQVNATYPGVQRVVSCTYTRTLGTVPNRAEMRIIPQASLPPANGTLTISHGSDFVSFPNCRVDAASIALTSHGHISSLRILDRRWKWAFPAVDGIYNVRQADATVRTGTLKSAQQLAALLFEVLGETAYDVSALPANDYPAIEWDCEPARLALERLCDLYGCDVDLDYLSNTPRIVVLGVGQNLPDNADVVNVSVGADFSEIPDAIELCGDFVLVQSKLKLEAIGVDTDGTLKLINQLSYTPDGGWVTSNPFDLIPEDTEENRHFANASVFRMFRAMTQADGSLNVPNYSGTVSAITQLYPLRRTIIQAYANEVGIDPQAAYVEGVFLAGGDPQPTENTAIGTRLENDYRLIPHEGILVFEEPVVKLNGSLEMAAPDLYFITSYNLANSTRGQYERYTRARQLANNGTPWLNIPRPSLKHQIRATYANDGVTIASIEDNKSAVDQFADALLDAMQAQFFAQGASHVVYRSIQPLRLDGARRQITWSVDRHRKKPAPSMTVATFNSENAIGSLRTRERRRLLAAEETLQKAEQDSERRRRLRRQLGVVQ